MAKSSWLTVSPTSGFGNKTIQNIGAAHTGRLQRQTVVTGRAIGIAMTKTYTVTQKAKEEFITIGASSYSVANTGGIVTVSGTSNSPKLTVSVGSGGTLGSLVVNGSTITNGSDISGDPGATAQYSWSIQIQVGENLTAVQRGINVTVTGSSSSVTDTVQIVQAASVFEYIFSIAAGTTSLPASGGNSAITAQLTTKRNGVEISTRAVTPALSGSATGFSISGTTVTAANRGTTLGEARSITVTGKFTTSETDETLTDTVVISQAANNRVIVYSKPNITDVSAADIPASGGSVSSASVSYSQSRHYYYDSGATENLSALTTGGTINYGAAVTAASLGTTIKNRAIVGTLTFTVSMNGQTSVEQDISVYQAKNVPVDAAIYEHNYTYPTGVIPASGGTKTPSSYSTVKLTWSSGSTSIVSYLGATGITAEYSDLTYSMIAATGFSINSSTGVVTAANRGTTEGAERKSGNCSRHIKWTITVSDTYGGGSFVVEDTKTLTTPVTQQANTATYGDVSLTVQTPVSCDVSGGDYRINPIYSQTVSFTSGDTRAGSVSVTYTQKAAMTGFSLSGNIVTVTENKTTSARNGYTVTVKATGEGSKTASKEVVFNQSLGVKSYATPVITGFTYPTIAAKGGTVTPTVTYSQTWGWNESTTNGGTITTGAALSFSGTGVNTSTGAVTAGTKGTTVSSATNVTTATVKVTLNGKTAQKQVTVQQAANAKTSITYGTPSVSLTVADIPAKGGTISSGTVTYSQSRTQNYTSGSTSPLSALTTGGTVSYSTGVSGSDLGTTTKARTKIGTLTATVTMNGKSGSDSADVYQQANSITYGRVTISGTGSVADIPAGGGSVSTASGYTASQTISYTSEHTRAGNVKFTYTTVSADSLGKTEKARTSVGTMTVTATGEGGQKATTTITVYQQANVRTTGDISYGEWQVSVYAREYISASSPCPASGDSFTIYSSASRTRVQEYNYTSGATDTETLSTETATPELSVSGEGGLTLDGNTATYANRGTTEGNLRSNTIVATYEEAYDTEQVYQEANVKTVGGISYGDWQVSVSANRYTTTSSPCPASGGTCTITASATRTRNQSYSYTSGATSTEAISNETGTPTLSISGTGASLSGTTVTWVTRGTEYSTTTRSATVKATMDTVIAEEVVYQAKNGYTEEWDNPVVDMQPSSHTISSIGNDWYVDSFSATQSGTRTYDSGSTQSVTNSEFTWSSSENVDWLSSQVEFNEDFCITSDDNEGSSSRSGVVTLTATGKGDKTGSDTITITQEAGAYLNVSPTSLSFEASGGTKTITIDTNESWTIS